MKLYHGTSERYVESILRNGITPRGNRKGNWQNTVTSNSRAVYLTTAYPIHFAKACVRREERLALLEVDTELLSFDLLAPDEDFLEQATRKDPKYSNCGKDMKERTLWFRKRALVEFKQHAPASVQHMGTCTYFGRIPPAALTRIAFVPQGHELYQMSDPSVGIANYGIMGAFYRNLTRLAFKDVSDLEDDAYWLMNMNDEIPDLSEIEVKDLVKK